MKPNKIKYDHNKVFVVVSNEEEFKSLVALEPEPEAKQEKSAHEYSTRRKENKAQEQAALNGSQVNACNSQVGSAKNEISIPISSTDKDFYKRESLLSKKRAHQEDFIKIQGEQMNTPDPGIYEHTDQDKEFLKGIDADPREYEIAVSIWEEASAINQPIVLLEEGLKELQAKKGVDIEKSRKVFEAMYNYWKDEREKLKRPLVRKFFKLNYQKENRNPNFAFRPRKEQKMRLRKVRSNEYENLEKLRTLKLNFETVLKLAQQTKLREELKACQFHLEMGAKMGSLKLDELKEVLLLGKDANEQSFELHSKVKRVVRQSKQQQHPVNPLAATHTLGASQNLQPAPVPVVAPMMAEVPEVKVEQSELDAAAMTRFVATLTEELSERKIVTKAL